MGLALTAVVQAEIRLHTRQEVTNELYQTTGELLSLLSTWNKEVIGWSRKCNPNGSTSTSTSTRWSNIRRVASSRKHVCKPHFKTTTRIPCSQTLYNSGILTKCVGNNTAWLKHNSNNFPRHHTSQNRVNTRLTTAYEQSTFGEVNRSPHVDDPVDKQNDLVLDGILFLHG